MIFRVKNAKICVIRIKEYQFAIQSLNVGFVFFCMHIINKDSVLGNDDEQVFAETNFQDGFVGIKDIDLALVEEI